MVRWILMFVVAGFLGCSGGGETVTDTGEKDITSSDVPIDTENSCNVEPTIRSLEDNYFAMSCTFSSCHSDTAAQGGLVLTSGNAYDNLVNVDVTSPLFPGEKLVVPGQPDQSNIIGRVELTAVGGTMPPNILEPLGPDCQIKALRDWIAAGAPKE